LFSYRYMGMTHPVGLTRTMLDWQAVQDDVFVTAEMSDSEVWALAQLLGSPAMSYALDQLIEDLQDVHLNVRIDFFHLVREVG